MTFSSISQSNTLGEDVLLMIFQHLDGEDLLNCEAVCRQWRDIFVAGTPWRRFFHRNKESSPLWRKVQKKLESNQPTADQCRDVCKDILRVGRNWRIGHFTKLTYAVDPRSANFITVSDDYVAWDFVRFEKPSQCSRGCFFLDTESTELKEIAISACSKCSTHCYCLNEMLTSSGDCDSGRLEIVDPNNRWAVNVLDEGETDEVFTRFAFGSQFFVAYNFCKDSDRERIRIWKMGNAPTLLKDRTFEYRNLQVLEVDEGFIVARRIVGLNVGTVLYFISTKSLEVTRSMILINGEYAYNRGLFYEYYENGIVRIFDVASGTYFNDVRIPFRKEDGRSVQFLDAWASSNSTCVVIGWKYSTMCGMYSHLSVYDLEAVKKANSDPGSRLLYTLQFQFDMQKFAMDDFRLAFNGNDGKNNRYVTVLKFANFGFVERKTSDWEDNSEANEDIQMKMIYDPCVNFPPLDSRKSVRTLNKSAEPMKTQGRNHLNFVNRLKWQRRKSCDNVTYFLCE